MKEQPTVPNGQNLAAHYEALRKEVVESSGRAHSMHGRALLMRKGMAGWMRGVGETAAHSGLPVQAGNALRLPVSIEQNLVAIMTSMAIATTREVMA